MQDQEALDMMKRCRDEIRLQRTIIEQLTPKAQAWDQICKVLNLLPQPSQGFAEDLAWRLDKRIDELIADMSKPTSADPYPVPEMEPEDDYDPDEGE